VAVSIDQAAANAIAARLAARLADATVLADWPDDSAPLQPKTIAVLAAGARADISVDPVAVGHVNIHDEIPTRITAGPVVDLATAIPVLNQGKSTWNAHTASTDVHKAADATNVVTAADAVDLPTAIALANNIAAVVAPHVGSTAYHDAADTKTAITAPLAVDLGTLVARAEQIRLQLNAHYVARVYTWRLRSCELPLQLDVWATSSAELDDLLARLEPELFVDATADELDGGGPVREGLLVDLADGWEGGVADAVFEAPQRIDSEDAVQRAEFRATYRGRADFVVTVKAQSARMAKLVFKNTVYDQTKTGAVPKTATVAYSPDDPGYTESHT